MRISLGILAIAVLAVRALPAQAPTRTEQELTRLEHAWSTAVVQRDSAFLESLYADEYVSIDEFGVARNKAEDLAVVTTGDWRLLSFELTGLRFHVYRDVAVVHGLNAQTGTYHGRDANGAYRFTDVFVRRQGRWQCVSTHVTLVTTR
jgi:ketosteroid isomerase-like protein